MNYSILKNGLINIIKNSSRELSYNDIRIIVNAHFNSLVRSIISKEKEIEEVRKKKEIEKMKIREELNVKP